MMSQPLATCSQTDKANFSKLAVTLRWEGFVKSQSITTVEVNIIKREVQLWRAEYKKILFIIMVAVNIIKREVQL